MKLYLRRADWTGKRGTDRLSPAGNLQLSECHLGRFPVDDIWVEEFFSVVELVGYVVECRWERDMTMCQGKRRRKGGREKGRERKQRGEKRGKRKVIIQYGR